MRTVKYIRRTPTELAQFRKAVAYFEDMGYPQYKATELAWDCFWSARIAKRNKIKLPEIY